MKSLALVAMVAAGLFFTAGTADAQYRTRSGVYVYPSSSYPTYTYSYPTYTYSYPSYSYPVYTYDNSRIVTSSYTPFTSSNVIIPADYSTSFYTPTYSNGFTYPNSNGYYNTGYYNNNGVTIDRRGVGFRGWRWRW